jgi:hypothetical protein
LLIIIIGLLLDFTSDNKMDSVYCSFSGNKRRLDTSGPVLFPLHTREIRNCIR